MWKVLSAALSKAKQIVRTNMDGNKICDDLRNNRVRAIRIKTTMPEPTIYVVLDALVRNTSCKILDLSNLRLGRHSCVALATVIRKNTHLRKLIINGSFLENVIVRCFLSFGYFARFAKRGFYLPSPLSVGVFLQGKQGRIRGKKLHSPRMSHKLFPL